ncbi:hypothetical protein G4B88_001063 [Cannabis sativa]|uniref:Pentatricopeptide repeat-containing protein n=1 Tax=Cannabis sativa TaxID=3483 RepID=A0A7J6DJ23_CANSA|nr:hypothetical protein G4B88_001063 [Cannabis sativa]
MLENSGTVLDVITYNVLIREIDSALKVLNRMSVDPDVVTYNTILRTLCDSGKLKEAMKVLDLWELRKDCYPNVFTYTNLALVLHSFKIEDKLFMNNRNTEKSSSIILRVSHGNRH